jgi:hypothetical protein
VNKISRAFDHIFTEDDWFNKVLVGGFYLVMTPLLIGLIMIMGFQIELTRKVIRDEPGMPLWRNASVLLKNGARAFIVSLWYAGIVVGMMLLLQIPLISATSVSILLIAHVLLNPVIVNQYASTNSIISCANPLMIVSFINNHPLGYISTIIMTTVFIFIAVFFGWMWIIVGWPMLIFLMLIVQTVAFAKL